MKGSCRHCYFCNKCVENFDHHCVWIKNCIGNKNYNQFIGYLLLIFIKLVMNVFFSIESKTIFNLGILSNVDKNAKMFKFFKLENLYTTKIKNIFSSVELILSVIVLIPIM